MTSHEKGFWSFELQKIKRLLRKVEARDISPISIVNTNSLISTKLPITQGTYVGNESIDSNFLGVNSGIGATFANNSNFLGFNSGLNAEYANSGNFLGVHAGSGATFANSSNFIGVQAGYGATNAGYSTFIGVETGYGATTAQYANFIGLRAGTSATNASHSNFIGVEAGFEATNASYSTLLGTAAGKTFVGNNIGSNNIIIGKNISLPNLTTNAVNLGGVIFARNTYSESPINPSIQATINGRVMIGTAVDDTVNRLQVSGTLISTQYKLAALNTAPISATDTGTLGEIKVAASYIYICIATNTWVRAALTTW